MILMFVCYQAKSLVDLDAIEKERETRQRESRDRVERAIAGDSRGHLSKELNWQQRNDQERAELADRWGNIFCKDGEWARDWQLLGTVHLLSSLRSPIMTVRGVWLTQVRGLSSCQSKANPTICVYGWCVVQDDP